MCASEWASGGIVYCARLVGHKLLNQWWITWRQPAHVYNGWAHTCKQMADGINHDGKASILHGLALSIFTHQNLDMGDSEILLSYGFSVTALQTRGWLEIILINTHSLCARKYTKVVGQAPVIPKNTITVCTVITY